MGTVDGCRSRGEAYHGRHGAEWSRPADSHWPSRNLGSAVGNADTRAAWEYHRRTSHSPVSVRASGHWLDWDNLPRPYKLYPTLPSLPLPAERPRSAEPALAALASPAAARSGERTPTLGELSTILHYSAGVTKRLTLPGGYMDFRAAACTGALYHVDLYLVCRELPGLAAADAASPHAIAPDPAIPSRSSKVAPPVGRHRTRLVLVAGVQYLNVSDTGRRP